MLHSCGMKRSLNRFEEETIARDYAPLTDAQLRSEYQRAWNVSLNHEMALIRAEQARRAKRVS